MRSLYPISPCLFSSFHLPSTECIPFPPVSLYLDHQTWRTHRIFSYVKQACGTIVITSWLQSRNTQLADMTGTVHHKVNPRSAVSASAGPQIDGNVRSGMVYGGNGTKTLPNRRGNAPALTDMTRRHRKPRCFRRYRVNIEPETMRRDQTRDTRKTLRSRVEIEIPTKGQICCRLPF